MGKRIFYGWYIVVACVLIAVAGIGFQNTASIFVRPVTEDLGIYRSEFTFFRTIIVLVSIPLMPIYGKLVQKYSIKKIMLAGTLLSSLAFMSYSFVTALWQFYLLAIFQGLFIGAANFMVMGILISRWFEEKRGFALGVAFAGSGLGAAIMVPLVSQVIEAFDWRWGFRFSGLLAIAILLPAILILVKDRPEDIGLLAYGSKNDNNGGVSDAKSRPEEGLIRKDAIRTPAFWLLVVALFGLSISAGGPNAHTAPYLGDLGYYVGIISIMVSVSMVLLTVGKIIMGHVFDRFGTVVGGIALGVFCILSPIFALLSANPVAPWLHAIFLGLASTGFSIPVNIYAMKLFGRKDFPAILSVLSIVTAMGGAFAPPAMGLMFDVFGHYTYAWFGLVVTGVVVTVCLTAAYMLRPYFSEKHKWRIEN